MGADIPVGMNVVIASNSEQLPSLDQHFHGLLLIEVIQLTERQLLRKLTVTHRILEP
jgi:hypothetical protein